jgi:hypothetical protein
MMLLAAALCGLAGVTRAQESRADCSVTITQASSGSILSEVKCTGITEPNVTFCKGLFHTATYSWNGERSASCKQCHRVARCCATVLHQASSHKLSLEEPLSATVNVAPLMRPTLPLLKRRGRCAHLKSRTTGSDTMPSLITIGFTPQGNIPLYPSSLPLLTGAAAVPISEQDDRFSDTMPSLITIGFTPQGNSSTLLPALKVEALLHGLTLPDAGTAFTRGSSYLWEAVSGLTLTAFGELQIQGSVVDNVSSTVPGNDHSFGAIRVVKDTRMTHGPAVVRVVNSSFQNSACSKKRCGALFIQDG